VLNNIGSTLGGTCFSYFWLESYVVRYHAFCYFQAENNFGSIQVRNRVKTILRGITE